MIWMQPHDAPLHCRVKVEDHEDPDDLVNRIMPAPLGDPRRHIAGDAEVHEGLVLNVKELVDQEAPRLLLQADHLEHLARVLLDVLIDVQPGPEAPGGRTDTRP